MRKNQNQTPNQQLKKQSKKKPRQRAIADTPPPVKLTPRQAVEQLRALVQQVPDVTSLTTQERILLKNSKRLPENVVQASITILDDILRQALGVFQQNALLRGQRRDVGDLLYESTQLLHCLKGCQLDRRRCIRGGTLTGLLLRLLLQLLVRGLILILSHGSNLLP